MKIVLQGYETYATITTPITFHKGVAHDVPDEVAADLLTVTDAMGLPAFVEAGAVPQVSAEVEEVAVEEVGEETPAEIAEAPAPKSKTVTVGKKAANTVVL